MAEVRLVRGYLGTIANNTRNGCCFALRKSSGFSHPFPAASKASFIITFVVSLRAAASSRRELEAARDNASEEQGLGRHQRGRIQDETRGLNLL